MIFTIKRAEGGCEAGEGASLLSRIAWETCKISMHLTLSLGGHISSVENHCIHCEPILHVGVFGDNHEMC